MAKRKLINIDDSAFEKAHLSRIEKYASQVDAIYKFAIDEFVKLSQTIPNFKPNAIFSFDDYPETKERVNKLLKSTYSNVEGTIRNGIKDEWKFAGTKNNHLVQAVLGTSKLTKEQISKYTNGNLNALAAFQNRKDGPDRLGLSDRIWNYVKDFQTELELGIDLGIGEGKSAAAIARQIKQYLDKPDMLFRRVRDNRSVGPVVNKFRLSKAAEQFNPGTGVYRSSYRNALRVTRTETNMAYRASDYERWQQLDFVVGIEIRLSNNPNHCPMCAALAGKYPKDFKFVGWHPQCRCHAISILKTAKEMDENDQRILSGQGTTNKSTNSITDVPQGFKDWVTLNQDRTKNAKNTPFWVKDNFKDGDITKGLAFNTKPSDKPVDQPSKKIKAKPEKSIKINLKDFIAGDLPTDKEVENIMLHYAQIKPENFRSGLGAVRIKTSQNYMMQHAQSYRPSTNQWVGKSDITISDNTFLRLGFNPARDFKSALNSIKEGIELTFNQEYSIEALWHEILHAKTQSPPRELTVAQTEAMETVNQFVARHTYSEFIETLGGKATHKKTILDKGYGYTSWITDFRKRLKTNGISEKTALTELTPILMKDYRSIQFELMKFFEKNKKK